MTERSVFHLTHVKMKEPTPSNPYYRIEYYDIRGKRQERSGGRTYTSAFQDLERIEEC